jgi:C_GCAxxG_C_C family probable redox protein
MPVSRIDTAVSAFTGGFSCSQSVFSAFSEGLGIDRAAALKISTAFGGGIAGMGLTCGAVTGALMVIGAKHGRTSAGDDTAKQKTYEMSREFMRRFTERHGSITCRDLLDVDISTPEGKEQAAQSGLTKTLCPRLVAYAVEILEEIV